MKNKPPPHAVTWLSVQPVTLASPLTIYYNVATDFTQLGWLVLVRYAMHHRQNL